MRDMREDGTRRAALDWLQMVLACILLLNGVAPVAVVLGNWAVLPYLGVTVSAVCAVRQAQRRQGF